MPSQRTRQRQVLSLAAFMLCATSLIGCTNSHQEWMDNAETRWNGIRSAAMLDMAKGQFEAGALDQAEKTINEAAAVDASNPQLHLMAGRICLERGQLERAYRLFELSKELDGNNAETYYYQGVVLQRWHQHEAALDVYKKAYELEADKANRMLAVAETYVALDRPEDAIALLEEKKFYFDQNAGLRAMLGHLYSMKNEHRLAVENFRQATMLDPENIRYQEELALAQVAANAHADAVHTLKLLLDRPEYSDRNDLKRSLASAEASLGRLDAARQIYIGLTRQDPTNTADWIRLGEICWKTEDLGGALIAANRAITLAPQRHEGYLLSGLVWQKREKFENALEMFDRAAELAPQDSTPLILRGISLQKTDRKAAAAEAYTEALKRNPEDVRAQRLLAQIDTN
ncbi:tetratricopeptide repeat protein [Algisphaera agarilytica]|uniref:Tetratricopeptide (TPR) repeat protein n=1 Tax=Algisphaera agarilytica TaxID=1385975 RepID=A0A7X0LKN9_9BACT|nr:tetratricopeptide repeat protein [Algisphaera agarilytica]MBB6430034.1 tetratricopeptide (TPR) repeat protein [Algisphaera agarilytica]